MKFCFLLFFVCSVCRGQTLNQKLDHVRDERISVEKALLDAEKTKKTTEDQLKRLKTLQKLQTEEKTLTNQRLDTLEKYLVELQARREELGRKIERARLDVRQKFSKLVHPLFAQSEALLRGDADEGERRLKESVISSVAVSQLKELEVLLSDLHDAEDIESRIEQEKQQISSLLQDISEQESLIQFHQKIRQNLSKEAKETRMKQLEEYQRLKVSEVEIEKMISEFQAHSKQEKDEDQKRSAAVISFRPKSLPWPMKGKVIETYGQHKDEASGLNIFKKGIQILTVSDNAEVLAALDGTVQFSGDIPGKGKVLIVEHPHSIYTIYGGMKEVLKISGDVVRAREVIARAEAEKPVYFEIRVKNVAIDPIKWLQ